MTGFPDAVEGFVPHAYVPIAWKGGTGAEGTSPNTQLVIGQRLRRRLSALAFEFACCISGARAEAHSFYSGGACAAARPQLSTSLTAYAAGAVRPNTAAAAACQSGSDKSIRVGLPSHH